MDKFTKWAEVVAIRTIPAGSAVKLIKGLVSRFGVPNRIITDNGSVTPTMRLYLPRVEARLRGITALWFCRKKGHLHTIACNEQEWDKELAYNRHFTQ